MSPGVRFFRHIIFVLAVISLIPTIKRLIPMAKRVREIKRLKKSYDVMSVEGEVISVHIEQIAEMDTQYDIEVEYEVGYMKYIKEFIVMNKQSLRVGQKVMLLYDRDDPETAMLQEMQGLLGEEHGLKGAIFSLIVAAILIIAYAALFISEITSGVFM